MNTLECIITRRSIRKFTSQPISKQTISILLKAAMWAPSARNLQAWHFVVVDNKQLLHSLSEIHPHGKMLCNAPLAILICGNLQIEPMPEYNAINCSAATQNLLLAAHDSGLGAVWLGVYPKLERIAGISQLLQLPEYIIPISLLALGFPDEEKTSPERYDEAKISFNLWK